MSFVRDSMKEMKTSRSLASYLDVSQYILKEHSPVLKPQSPEYHHSQVTFFHVVYINYQVFGCFCSSLTDPLLNGLCITLHSTFLSIQIALFDDSQEVEPLELDPTQIVLTPITSGLIRQEVQDILDDFILDGQNLNSAQEGKEAMKRKAEKIKLRKGYGFQLFKFECDLDKIIQYEEQQSFQSQLNGSFNSQSEEFVEDDNCCINSNTFHTVWSGKQKNRQKISKDTDQQYQTTIDASILDYSESIERFSKNPKLEIFKKIKQIQAMNFETDQQEKKILIKKHLQAYLLQYEVFCFQQAWKQLDCSLKSTITVLKSGLQETFNKKVGSISFQNRRIKLMKYLEKKKRRIWRKKVSYDCRKKVADGRLRIKGKFVTREQACEQLGVENLDNYNPEQIKQMLQRKMDEGLQQEVC